MNGDRRRQAVVEHLAHRAALTTGALLARLRLRAHDAARASVAAEEHHVHRDDDGKEEHQ